MPIIKNLKSKSPAEVVDIFNVSKRQVERIRKRYQETGNVHDRPRLGRPRKTTARYNSSRRSGSQRCLFRQELYVGFLLAMVSTVVLLPRETSTKQETAKKPCCLHQRPTAWQKDGQQKFWFFRWIVSWAPSQAPPISLMTLKGPSGPTVHPEDSQIWRWKDY